MLNQRMKQIRSGRIQCFAVGMLAVMLVSCASTGPSVSREDLKKKGEEFNSKFFEASKTWLPRIYRVGYPLLASPVPGHKSEEAKYNFIGIGVDKLKDFSRKANGIEKSVKGILALGTYPGSKAENADIRMGDVILSLDGRKTKNLGSYFKRIRSAKGETVQVEIWRKGEKLKREIPVEKVYYNAQFFLAPTPHFDANALFSKIHVGIGAIRYCRNDDELAVIMGHELAHTTLKHSAKSLGSGIGLGIGYGAVAGVINAFTFPGVGDALMQPAMHATQAALSRRYEREADYFGLRHAFHSGFNVENGTGVFSRLGSDAPGIELLAYTFASHPKTPERFLRFEKTILELKSNFPERFPMKKSKDWDVTIPVQAGETLEEALERILEEAKAESAKIRIPAEQKLKEEAARATGQHPQLQLESVQLVERSAPADQMLRKFANSSTTSEKDTASLANPDTIPSSVNPAPKR